MDSITQALLGAVIARAATRSTGGQALAAGAFFGVLPDLDIVAGLWSTDVETFVTHRSLTHSFVVMTPVAAALAWILGRARLGGFRGGEWFALLGACFATHFLLDLCTSYGTQLLWPLDKTPFALSWVFIVDPAYSLPLLAAGGWIWRRARKARRSGDDDSRAQRKIACFFLAATTAYLALGGFFQHLARERFSQSLTALGIETESLRGFTTQNAPLTIFQWRAIAVDEGGDRTAHWSVFAPAAGIAWENRRASEQEKSAAAALAAHPDFVALRRFSRGLLRVEVDGGEWRVVDLRFGADGFRPFSFVARRDGLTAAAFTNRPQQDAEKIAAEWRRWRRRFF